MSEIPFHPLADAFPLLDGESFRELVEDVRAHGLRAPIVMHEGQILDGRNRYRACIAAQREVMFRLLEPEDGDPVAFVISTNLRRRHLNESQRAMVAAKLANMRQGARADRPPANLPDVPVRELAQPEAARLLNVSERSVRTAKEVRDRGTPELIREVEAGRASVAAAADVATLPEPEQREIVAKGEAEILAAAKAIRCERAKRRQEENAALKAEAVAAVPDGKFETIIIDPPWDMQEIERDVAPNQVAFDYPTMTEAELEEFQVSGMAADDCHVFCWTTQRFLPAAIRLVGAWGFRYCLTMVWHKPGGFQPFGLPQFNCEFVIYGRRGSPSFVETKAFACAFHGNRREHSRKPDEFYDLIRRVTAGPRIDVFSREPRAGFEQFGNETARFAA